MYSISEFSKLSRVTVKALRFYEKAGIFKPKKKGENQYRYYNTNQLL